ncbi:complex I intermediate-associated protein-like protein CIA30 [Westerdykella ornata]|uniref:Complex I intermediate-associated protein-like protein CIA30 n=1 Tax=Westerdykella ornata TaxID=318751 RepID=A0A6A6JTX2_WESOR|nr:complex I intermediate-associated protein-like protein CIA30 [Westerdykella ornata]KAF2279553.1 complex I intermediate-associated protein-like protein CIA30 [Westerdykella ornata]
MIPTARCLAPGFWRRSLDEFGRLSRRVLKFESLQRPEKAFPLILFDSPDDLTRCKRMSDKDIGGFSTVHLDFHPASDKEPAHARFHGEISTELPKNQPLVERTGYAGWRTRDPGYTIFGKSLWDVDSYAYLAVHFKSDGRKYFVNVQTESIVPTDIHQHRLYTKTPGEWETLLIKWNEFVRTNHGQVVEPQREMLTQKVRSVGMSVIDRITGPYDLSISRIWATNGGPEDEILRSVRGHISGIPVAASRPRKYGKLAIKPKDKPENAHAD